MTKVNKIMAYGTGAVTIIGGIVSVIFWLNSNVVWASDRADDQQKQQQQRDVDREFSILTRIGVLQEKRARIKDPELRRELDLKIDRWRKLLEKFDAKKIEGKKDGD